MTDRRVNFELKKIYTEPEAAGSLSGISALYKAGKSKNIRNLKVKNAEQFLQEQKSYKLHKPIRHKYPTSRILTFKINDLWEADLISKLNMADRNDGNSFIFTVIDTFSKRAYALPLKNKEGQTVTKAFEKILKQAKSKPEFLRTDRGTEFLNYQFQKLLADKNIKFYSTTDPLKKQTKCAIIERFNRSLQNKLQRFFTLQKTYRWIEVLPKLLKSYNSSYHRSIRMAPNEVNSSNEKEVFRNLFPNFQRKHLRPQKFKFEVGDRVRVQRESSKFAKGYTQTFTDKIYEIAKQIHGYNVPRYKLKDPVNGEIKDGSFYEQELNFE